jgi:hypothetical protein
MIFFTTPIQQVVERLRAALACFTRPANDQLDIKRSAVVRLKADALENLRLVQQVEAPGELWWHGYTEALKHLLEMEDWE